MNGDDPCCDDCESKPSPARPHSREPLQSQLATVGLGASNAIPMGLAGTGRKACQSAGGFIESRGLPAQRDRAGRLASCGLSAPFGAGAPLRESAELRAARAVRPALDRSRSANAVVTQPLPGMSPEKGAVGGPFAVTPRATYADEAGARDRVLKSGALNLLPPSNNLAARPRTARVEDLPTRELRSPSGTRHCLSPSRFQALLEAWRQLDIAPK